MRLLGTVCGALIAALMASATPELVYIGTYTDWSLLLPVHRNPPGPRSAGIYGFRFDSATGELTPLGLVAESVNPTFLAIAPDSRSLYAANEIYTFGGEPTGTASAFAIDPATGRLHLLNRMPTGGTGPCYVQVDASGRDLLVANFGSGSVAVLPLSADGRLHPASAFVQDEGGGPNPRQAGPHAHSFNVTPDNRYAIEAEFGEDKLCVFRFDAAAGRLTPAAPPTFVLPPASAPRHLAFHPGGTIAYAINEIASTITVLGYDAGTGALSFRQTVSTLPPGFAGKNTAAEVLVHPSGHYLYASNRGHNSIAVFEVDAAGLLQPRGFVPCGGRTPRGFGLDPSGRWLIVANQDTHHLAVFALDPASGLPVPRGPGADVPSPVCVRFL